MKTNSPDLTPPKQRVDAWTSEFPNALRTRVQRSHPLGRVLITGANGFVGSNLTTSLLGMGIDAVAAMRPGRQILPAIASRCGAIPIDEMQFDSVSAIKRKLSGIDTVIHTAGKVAARSYRDFLDTNYSTTARLMQAAADMPTPPRVVLVSSVAAAGPRTGTRPRQTGDVPQPVSMYGRSKLAGERAALRYANQVPVTIVRPGIVFGAADREVLRLMQVIAASHVNILAGYHMPRFPFIAVDDLVSCIVTAIRSGSPITAHKELLRSTPVFGEGIYYAADPSFASFAQFGAWVARALGHRWHLPLPLPLWIVKTAAWLNGSLSRADSADTFSVDKIREASAVGWECDVSPTIELGWAPAATLEQRVAETIAWYRQHDWL